MGIPTTAGTGSEAQSYALISDADTHVKMACGDPQAAFRIALLDPALTLTQPHERDGHGRLRCLVARGRIARHGEAIGHLRIFSRDAWRLLEAELRTGPGAPGDLKARGAMLLGAHEAGIAIEESMLGATHACANPLTARYGTLHGVAIAVMLPHVVQWNAAYCEEGYRELVDAMSTDEKAAGSVVWRAPGGAPRRPGAPRSTAGDASGARGKTE